MLGARKVVSAGEAKAQGHFSLALVHTRPPKHNHRPLCHILAGNKRALFRLCIPRRLGAQKCDSISGCIGRPCGDKKLKRGRLINKGQVLALSGALVWPYLLVSAAPPPAFAFCLVGLVCLVVRPAELEYDQRNDKREYERCYHQHRHHGGLTGRAASLLAMQLLCERDPRSRNGADGVPAAVLLPDVFRAFDEEDLRGIVVQQQLMRPRLDPDDESVLQCHVTRRVGSAVSRPAFRLQDVIRRHRAHRRRPRDAAEDDPVARTRLPEDPACRLTCIIDTGRAEVRPRGKGDRPVRAQVVLHHEERRVDTGRARTELDLGNVVLDAVEAVRRDGERSTLIPARRVNTDGEVGKREIANRIKTEPTKCLVLTIH